MGLAEKRKAEEIKTEHLPAFVEKLKGIVGYPVQVDINWESFTAFDQYPLSRLTDFVFNDLADGLKKICFDDMGKEAFKEKVSAIHISNTDEDGKFGIELKDKTLSLTEKLVGGSFSNHMPNMIVSYIEPLL